MRWTFGRKHVLCRSCGTRLTERDLRHARYLGQICSDCLEKEREKQLKAMGYVPSLEEARNYPDCHIIIDGDWGAVCYIVYPASLAKCNAEALRFLAHDFEEALFSTDTSGARVRYRHVGLNKRVDGFAVGEDQGIAIGKLWLPKWLSDSGLEGKIQQVLDGERERLDLSINKQSEVQVLHREYQSRKFKEDTE